MEWPSGNLTGSGRRHQGIIRRALWARTRIVRGLRLDLSEAVRFRDDSNVVALVRECTLDRRAHLAPCGASISTKPQLSTAEDVEVEDVPHPRLIRWPRITPCSGCDSKRALRKFLLVFPLTIPSVPEG